MGALSCCSGKETIDGLQMISNLTVVLFFPRVQPKKHHHEMPLSILALVPELEKRGYSPVLIDARRRAPGSSSPPHGSGPEC